MTKDLFLVLLKKEFYEFLQNIKFWVFLVFVMIIMGVFNFLNFNISDNKNLVLILLLVSQYVFDSCFNDIKSGATLFFINIKCSTVKIMLAKFVYACFIGIVVFIIASFFFIKTFKIIDLVWLVPFFTFITALSYNLTIITKKSNLLVLALVMVIATYSLEVIMHFEYILLKSIILIGATIAVIYASSILSKKLAYRAEI